MEMLPEVDKKSNGACRKLLPAMDSVTEFLKKKKLKACLVTEED